HRRGLRKRTERAAPGSVCMLVHDHYPTDVPEWRAARAGREAGGLRLTASKVLGGRGDGVLVRTNDDYTGRIPRLLRSRGAKPAGPDAFTRRSGRCVLPTRKVTGRRCRAIRPRGRTDLALL